MRTPIIAGNWKMNCTIPETEQLLDQLLAAGKPKSGARVVVAPPYVSLQAAAKKLSGSHIELSAQEMSEHGSGAYTGEISAQMLLTVGASLVILGHSERRQYHAESDTLVNAKVKAALAAGLTPIICVGETLDQRESDQTESVVGAQVKGCLEGLTDTDVTKCVIAYEPVWAIGTGKTATPEMAEAVHAFIRGELKSRSSEVADSVPILYGGSVKGANATGLLSQPNIDGALVGGASLKADEFVAIINAV